MIKSSNYDKPKETTLEYKTSVGPLHLSEISKILLHFFQKVLFFHCHQLLKSYSVIYFIFITWLSHMCLVFSEFLIVFLCRCCCCSCFVFTEVSFTFFSSITYFVPQVLNDQFIIYMPLFVDMFHESSDFIL